MTSLRPLIVIALVGAAGLGSAPARAQQTVPNEAPGGAPGEVPGQVPNDAPDAAPGPGQITAPRLLQRVEAVNPQGARGTGDVVLELTVDPDGRVLDPRVEHGLSPEHDRAALDAVRQWQFAPALQAGVPVAARIRVSFSFVDAPPPQPAPPVPAPVPPPVTSQPAPPASAPAAGTATAEPAPKASDAKRAESRTVFVHGKPQTRNELKSSSDFHVSHDVLAAAPHHEGVEVLRTAPGLYLARSEGNAVAHRYMLRGFDSEHGQDIEFRVAGLPINLPSHIHGQGYADLGFLIAETVDELRVTEGVHDPRQGDFAVAGSLDVRLAVRERGLRLRSEYGSFGSFRQLLLWAPEQQLRDSFAAVSLHHSDGFGENRRAQALSGVVQQGFTVDGFRVRAVGIAYGSRADSAGVLRKDDIDNGRVDFYDVYPHPTARAQNGLSNRVLVGMFAEQRGEAGDQTELGVWLGQDVFRLQQNFTGFSQRSRSLGGESGRGDLIEQRNHTQSAGLEARYGSVGAELAEAVEARLSVGLSTRFDAIDQEQNLLDATLRGQTWDERVDASINALNLGAFADLDFHLGPIFKLRAGFRADALSYEVDDALGNRAPATRPDDAFIVGFRRSAFGIAAGPRVSGDAAVLPWLTIHAAYGEGFRSPQARLLDDGEHTPFTKVRSADLGARFHPSERYQLTVSGYHTSLSDDVAFEADEGSLDRIGRTRRVGGVVHAELRPLPGWIAAASVTYVDAELLEPPPASPEEPDPPFRAGQDLPFVPPLVARADLGWSGPLAALSNGRTVSLEVGSGASVLSARPLPYGQFAAPFWVLDCGLSVGLEPFELGLQVFNVLDARYSALEYSFVSNWDPEAPGSRLPARHSSAGSPRTIMGSLELQL